MPTFDTPEPLSATLEFESGTARISASKRLDTVVSVLPADDREEADVTMAEQVQVTCADGHLAIRGPKRRSMFGKVGSISVTIELPAGSDVRAAAPVGAFTAEGRLGDSRIESIAGDIRVAEAAAAFLRTGHGDIHLDRATGDAEVEAAGRVDIGTVTGSATVKEPPR
ncbi:hypothetical protein RB200_11985 [Streptomyces sp. PmtG]